MQLLTGHGSFQKFLHRIGKVPSEACLICGAARDDAEHVLIACPEYAPQREVLTALPRGTGGSLHVGAPCHFLLGEMGRVPRVCGLRHGGPSGGGIRGRPPLPSGARAAGPGGCGREGPRAHQAREKKKEGRPPMIARGGGVTPPPDGVPMRGAVFFYRVLFFIRVFIAFFIRVFIRVFLFFFFMVMVFFFFYGGGRLKLVLS